MSTTTEVEPLQPNHATWALLQEVFKPDGNANAVLWAAHRLQQLTGEAGSDVPIKPGPRSFVILTNSGHWGRGKTPPDAARAVLGAGGGKTDRALLVLVLNDDTPEVNQGGSVIANCDACMITIGVVGTVGGILRANPEEKE